MPHLAPTYAAVACLAEIATVEAVKCVNRAKCVAFLARCKDKSTGGYRMHEGGETDTRGCYTPWRWRDCSGWVVRTFRARESARLSSFGDARRTTGASRPLTGVRRTAGAPTAASPPRSATARTRCRPAGARDGLAHRQGARRTFPVRTNKLVHGCSAFWLLGAFPPCWTSASRKLVARVVAFQRGAGGCRRGVPVDDDDDAHRATKAATIASRRPAGALSAFTGVALCSRATSCRSERVGCRRVRVPRSPRARCRGGCCCAASSPSAACETRARAKGGITTTRATAVSGLRRRVHWGSDGLVGPAAAQPEGRTGRPARERHRGQAREWTRLVAHLRCNAKDC